MTQTLTPKPERIKLQKLEKNPPTQKRLIKVMYEILHSPEAYSLTQGDAVYLVDDKVFDARLEVWKGFYHGIMTSWKLWYTYDPTSKRLHVEGSSNMAPYVPGERRRWDISKFSFEISSAGLLGVENLIAIHGESK